MGVEQGCWSLSLLPTLSLATCHALSCRSPFPHVLRWMKPLPTSHLLWCKLLHLPCSSQGFGAGTTLPIPLCEQTAAFNFLLHVLFSLTSHTIQGFSFKKRHSPPLPCMHISLPLSSLIAKPHMAWCPCRALRWHHRGAPCSGAAGVIYPWTQALSSCWKKNIWAISREEAHSVMKVYIKQLLYQRSWKNNFFLNSTVSFPIFFKQKLKHLSY